MCDESEATYSVPGYSGHERGLVRHCDRCPHHATIGSQEIRHDGLRPECVREYGTESRGYYSSPCDGPMRPLFMQVSWIGCVLETRERNYHDDSDFYALVWDDSEQRVRSIDYATTRGWTYPNSATVDATPEILAKVEAWSLEQARKAMAARIESPRPEDLTSGIECELKKACNTRAAASEPCRKCSGLGYWQNPKRTNDRRPCFGCNGSGSRKIAAPKGTPMVKHPAGKRGTVVRTFSNRSKFGTWDYGSRVELRTATGELFTVSCDAVRLIMTVPEVKHAPNLVTAVYMTSGLPAGIQAVL